jgi:hypothetical protein
MHCALCLAVWQALPYLSGGECGAQAAHLGVGLRGFGGGGIDVGLGAGQVGGDVLGCIFEPRSLGVAARRPERIE